MAVCSGEPSRRGVVSNSITPNLPEDRTTQLPLLVEGSLKFWGKPMKTNIATITIFLAGLFIATLAQAQGSLEGAWAVKEVAVTGGENPGTNMNPQPSLYLFTDGHYSIMFVPGTESRPDSPENPGDFSDDEIIESFNTFVANSGSYETSGATLSYNVIVARVPSFMGAMPEVDYSVQGETLVLTATDDNGVSTRTTLTRL